MADLYKAVDEGNYHKVKEIIKKKKININYQDNFEYNFTSLHLASVKNEPEIVRLLLRSPQLDLNLVNNNGETAFFRSCLNGHIEIVRAFLMDKRLDPNKPDNRGQTPFFIACKEERLAVIKLLMLDDRVDMNQSNHYGWTPLIRACHTGKVEVVRLLTNCHKVNLLCETQPLNQDWSSPLIKCGETALGVSKQKGFTEVVSLVLESLFERGFVEITCDVRDNQAHLLQLFAVSPKIRFLRLENSNLDSKFLKSIEQYLASQPLEVISIKKNRLGVEGAQVMASLISKNTRLKSISIKDCHLGPEGNLLVLQSLAFVADKPKTFALRNLELDESHLKSFQGLEKVPIEIQKQGANSISKYLCEGMMLSNEVFSSVSLPINFSSSPSSSLSSTCCSLSSSPKKSLLALNNNNMSKKVPSYSTS